MKVVIGADLGESFGRWKLGNDEELIPLISAANIACGWHAGDPMIMRHTVQLCKKHGVSIGSHCGFPDLMGFGRRRMEISPEEFKNYIIYQTGALMAIAKVEGAKVEFATTHGAMGSLAFASTEFAKAYIEAMLEVDPNFIIRAPYGPQGELIAEEARKQGVRFVLKHFLADRGYHKDGRLANRFGYKAHPRAVIHDAEEVVERAMRVVKEKKLESVEGEVIHMDIQMISVHGDTPGAIENARAIRKGLEAGGIEIVPITKLV